MSGSNLIEEENTAPKEIRVLGPCPRCAAPVQYLQTQREGKMGLLSVYCQGCGAEKWRGSGKPGPYRNLQERLRRMKQEYAALQKEMARE